MPRPRRFFFPGHPLHVVQRGHDRRAVFFSDSDRHVYLQILQDATMRHEFEVHAYVLMTNHVHLLLTPATPSSVPAFFSAVGRRFARMVKRREGRAGSLFEGRYRASVIGDQGYLAHCHAYIELNPVRGGLVSRPVDYAWSSCRHYLGLRIDPLITYCATFIASGRDPLERMAVHRAALDAGVPPRRADEIRIQTLRGGVACDASQRDRFEAESARNLPRARRGRPNVSKKKGPGPFS